MGLFDFLAPKKKILIQNDKLMLQVFPDGHRQVLAESSELQGLLKGALSKDESGVLLTKAKSLLHISSDKSFDRCKNYIIQRSGGKLSERDAYLVYEFLCSKLRIQPTKIGTMGGTSKENPIVITRPEESALLRTREEVRNVLVQCSETDSAKLPSDGMQDKVLDGMISEVMKMELIKDMFGEEKKVWECGTRMYFGAIQSQEIIFKDGRAPITLYFDFSQFGGA